MNRLVPPRIALGVALGLALAAPFPVQADADRLSITQSGDTVTVEGPLQGAAESLFLDALARALLATPHPRPIRVVLDSPGGLEATGHKLVATIRAAQSQGAVIETAVPPGRGCMSACTLVFAAGEPRTASPTSVFLFHAISYQGARSEDEIRSDLDDATARFLATIGSASPGLQRHLAETGALAAGGEMVASADDLHRDFPDFVTELR